MQQFQVLPRICTGPGAVRALRSFAGARALLLADAPSVAAVRQLQAVLPGTALFPCPSRIVQSPDGLQRAAQAASGWGIQSILALGSPDPIQLAKRLRLLLPRHIPLVCIPDVSGTAECFSDTVPLYSGQPSRTLSDRALLPDCVILDATLTPSGTAAQQTDAALYQAALAIEAVCASGASTLSNALALDVLAQLFPLLHRQMPPDTQLLLQTGCAAGAAANSAGTGLCMALQRAACALQPELAPGAVSLLLLPSVLAFYASECTGPIQLLSSRLGWPDGPEPALGQLPDVLWRSASMCRTMLCAHMHAIVSIAGSDPRLAGSPRPAGPAELRTLLRNALRPHQPQSAASQSSASRTR